MLSVWIGENRAPLGRKTITVGVSPARWAGLRNGCAVAARLGRSTDTGLTGKAGILRASAHEAGVGISSFGILRSFVIRILLRSFVI